MSKWTSDLESRGRAVHRTYSIAAEEGQSLQTILELFWEKVCLAFLDEESSEWDTIIVAIRPNTGRIIALPGKNGQFVLNRHVAVLVKSGDIEQIYCDLPDESPGDFEIGFSKLIEFLIDQIISAGKSSRAQAAIQVAKASRDLKILAIRYDDLNSARLISL